MMPKVPAA
jgi:hypothetical protein